MNFRAKIDFDNSSSLRSQSQYHEKRDFESNFQTLCSTRKRRIEFMVTICVAGKKEIQIQHLETRKQVCFPIADKLKFSSDI